MCGIIAVLSKTSIDLSIFFESFKLLKNRGYDSAGISLIENSQLYLYKELTHTSIDALEKMTSHHLSTNIIAHTRWATHGNISISNCHPHLDTIVQKYIIIHNGIVENYNELYNILFENQIQCNSQTDSEILLNYIIYQHLHLQSKCIQDTFYHISSTILGNFSFILQSLETPHQLFCYRRNYPLFIGKSLDSYMILSEISSFPPSIQIYESIQNDHFEIIDLNYPLKNSTPYIYQNMELQTSFQHFMIKEIYEQESIIQKTYDSINTISILDVLFASENILLFGCGSSYYASLFIEYFYIHYLQNKNVRVFDASNFDIEYLDSNKNYTGLFISQSGETRDIIYSLSLFHKKNKKNISIAITNYTHSFLTTLTHYSVSTCAGKEISVASTKSFLSQIVLFILLIYKFKKWDFTFLLHLSFRSFIDSYIDNSLYPLPNLSSYKNIFVIGRHLDYLIALEGSLKLKEVSYIHAEAFSSNSLKHGPFALLDKNVLVLFIVTDIKDALKSLNNIQEIHSRESKLIVMTTSEIQKLYSFPIDYLTIPSHPFNFLYAIILLQLMSYKIALDKNINPDYPKNLAKVVTVE
jgi:glucosamine--fructose-6-phosphate aminotransferase (isomerizing)